MRRPLLPPASASARPVPAPGRVIFLRARHLLGPCDAGTSGPGLLRGSVGAVEYL
ncbi:hypothetical protein AvCA_44100 [Azotobacter vinelandii CA]|uniref:Uncharacterized protein n=2 Tax=Azotobacter vinelandii TaxID=354 RepID=C1DGN5_AZOVD|nr:hypothetical protein Avin_44100 [Azotobacter vinelandii DJ]AGK14366.1 hypothetical protein AvCA_44100 [Azotobacter vinelandii CA]AGK21981.1 hypothetical protein AvCA6_44100 [Azotobacter vinelandii CA6]